MSLFKPVEGIGAKPIITVELDGRKINVYPEQSVAAALLAAGVRHARTTPVSGAPRAPYCMMGVCFECLMEIDGVANRQTCLVQIKDGMRIRTQHGAREWNAAAADDKQTEGVGYGT